MVRTCVVKSCPTRSKVKNKKNYTPQSLSYFRPTTTARLEKWKLSLGMALKANDHICHLHFKESDIKMYEQFNIKGELKIFPMGKKILKDEAFPTIHHQFGPIPSHELQANINDLHQQNCMDQQELLDMVHEETTTTESLESFRNDFLKFSLLPPFWLYVDKPNGLEFIRMDPATKLIKNYIRLNENLSITVISPNNEELALNEKISSYDRICEYLQYVESWPLCVGTQIDNQNSKTCTGVIVGDDTYLRNQPNPRCKSCRILRNRLQCRRSTTTMLVTTTGTKQRASNIVKQLKRLKSMKIRLRKKIINIRAECAKKSDSIVQEAILQLPAEFHNVVNSCFEAAKKKNMQGRRYTLEWIYECLLIRLKSRKTYQFIRTRNILPLPSMETLNKFIRKISCSAYGFQPAIFYSLKERCRAMRKGEKRGVILIDEMKLSEGVFFDAQSMKFSGFVYLGQHTPEDLKHKTADHALVFKFVPFQGRWVQALGCFLTKNSCKSEPLHKLILECTVLMENSGICVDAVVMDGAPWNRGVWKIFGVDENNISCEHPCDSLRRLWMISDFNHLLKCFRTSTLNEKLDEFKTPYGIVKKKHWEALLEEENYRQPSLKIAYKLTPSHLKPKGFQAMNVPLAVEVFGHEVSVAMAHLQPICEKLKDSTPTQKFISLVFNLIQAMSSRTPRDALYAGGNCRQKQAILEFLKFLEQWEKLEKKIPVTRSTLLGLKVTLRATLEILDMLNNECEYNYLMTATLSQDPLERFFSVMRNSCGGNDHPDPKMFAQVYRLASCFSLIRPPKGCNVSGEDLLRSVVGAEKVLTSTNKDKELWMENIDTMLESGEPLLESSSIDVDHDYNEAITSDAVQSYIAGYLVRKLRKVVKCVDCLQALQMSAEDGKRLQRNDVINKMDLYGGLIFASDELFNLTKQLEKCVLRAVSKALTNVETIDDISQELKKEELLRVGCVEHNKEFTKKIIDIYIVMRAHFLAKSENKRYDAAKIKTKMNRKNAKLLS